MSKLSGRSAKTVRRCGVAWIVVAPVLWVMASISTVKSPTTYYIQLLAFSTVAAVGLVCGVLALFRYTWAAWGLFAVSCAGAVYFLGIAVYMVIFPFVPWTTLTHPGLAALPMSLALAVMVAPPGIPFALMAVALRRALRIA